MLFLILRSYLNADTNYRNYPEWATYLALLILAFVVYLLLKGKRK